MPTKTHLIAPLIKTADLPDELAKASEGSDIDKWFYATVETQDREGDIVRVDGIDLNKYAEGGRAIKFISSHKRTPADDGRLPIVGKAVKWSKTVHKSAGQKALAVGVKFAPTELGQEMKALYDGGFLDDISIGFESVEKQPIQGAGYDYTKSALGEFSACITGMNPFAGVLRALDEETRPESKAGTVTIRLGDYETTMPLEQYVKEQNQPPANWKADFDAFAKSINSRLDDVTCAVEALASKDEEQIKGRATTPPAQTATVHADTVAAFKALAARL